MRVNTTLELDPKFITSMETAEREERAVKFQLASMQQNLKRLGDRVETYKRKVETYRQKMARRTQERERYIESVREMEERLTNAVEIQQAGAVTIASRTGRFLKRFSDFLLEGEPKIKRQKQ